LFLLGSIGETFEINGLSHFPMDIESSIEKCHRNIVPGGSAVFQAGGLIVVLVEVARKAYLASIVPVIVNAILNEHQIVVDIVAFVNKGDFPRSRLGEKQRGKILATWVTRKMRTMAQFGIRDADSALSDVTEAAEPRSGIGSIQNGSVIASSLRNVEAAPQILEQRELEQHQLQEQQQLQQPQQTSYAPLPTGISEMPAQAYESSIQESPPLAENGTAKSDDTPTNQAQGHFELPAVASYNTDQSQSQQMDRFGTNMTDYTTPTFVTAHEAPQDLLPPRVGPKPVSDALRSSLPAAEGREGDLWSLPSQAQSRSQGGLRVHNRSSTEQEDEWPQEALMHMNLAGHSRSGSQL